MIGLARVGTPAAFGNPKKAKQSADRFLTGALDSFFGVRPVMGAKNAALMLPQTGLLPQGLVLEDVECSGMHPAVLQTFD